MATPRTRKATRVAKRGARRTNVGAGTVRTTARNPWIVMRRSKIHGRGVYARRFIPKGTRVIEYTGEHISNAEADRRYDDDTMPEHHTFLFILNSRTCTDAAVGGNISRYINHSCDPNCIAWIEDQHIWIDALRDIPLGDELAYDYEYDFLPSYTVKDLDFYRCECGSRNCRGTIVDVPKNKRHLIQALKRLQRAGSRK